jgi:tyrosine aminotransferase
VQVEPDHVIVASGCSGALELVLSTLLDTNDHHPSILLVPQPGYPLYQVIAESHGAIVMHYRLLPDKNWEIDLNHVRELMKQRGTRIRGMIVNNPSNATGAVYTADHLFAIIRMADECRLPIVADEEYGDLTFGMHRFHPLAVMAGRAGHRVPVITCSGLAKQYLLPGWRMGWAVFHDNHFQSLREIQAGAKRLAQVGGTGASHLVQDVVPALLEHANDSTGEGGDAVRVWKQDLVQHLEEQANFLHQQLSQAPGLQVMEAQGAMYCMIRFDPQDFSLGIQNDVDFCRLLLTEENVLVLPGTCYGVPNVLRVVFCAPTPTLKDATSRMIEFCERHYQYKSKK